MHVWYCTRDCTAFYIAVDIVFDTVFILYRIVYLLLYLIVFFITILILFLTLYFILLLLQHWRKGIDSLVNLAPACFLWVSWSTHELFIVDHKLELLREYSKKIWNPSHAFLADPWEVTVLHEKTRVNNLLTLYLEVFSAQIPLCYMQFRNALSAWTARSTQAPPDLFPVYLQVPASDEAYQVPHDQTHILTCSL